MSPRMTNDESFYWSLGLAVAVMIIVFLPGLLCRAPKKTGRFAFQDDSDEDDDSHGEARVAVKAKEE